MSREIIHLEVGKTKKNKRVKKAYINPEKLTDEAIFIS